MLFLIIQFSHLLVHSEPLFCGGDISQTEDIPDHKRHLQTRSSVLSPIRLFYYLYNFDLGDATLNSYFSSTLLPAANDFFSQSLSVYPIQDNLKLSSTNCLSSVVIPDEHKTVGVPNADLIIYITSNNLTTVSYVAQAGVCERQSGGLNNVLAGTVIINIPNFASSSFSSHLNTLTHEISHILAYSSTSFNYFKTSDGTPYLTDTLKKVVNVRGVDKTLIASPNVLQKAKEAFGCDSIEGIEFEEYGSSGSHWDKRIMMNDFMTSFIPAEPYWSTISLALFQDSGWYEVNYNLALRPIFGKTSGCSFFTNPCLLNGVSQDPNIWCDTQGSWTCDSLALNKGTCKVSTYTTDLPLWFQYFSIPTTGGSDGYSDYCPYRLRYSNGACRGNSVSTFTLSKSNEVISMQSRCFVSNLVISGYTQNPPYSACYPVIACSSSSASVQIGTQILECPFTGGTFTVPGYTGTITCPASSILCDDVPCKNFCYSRGKCVKGICSCFKGFGGDDCSAVCSSNCALCSLSGCDVCNPSYYLYAGNCIICPDNCYECSSETVCINCQSGFYVDSNSLCSLCPSLCLTCSDYSTCTSCKSGYYIVSGRCVLICPSNCVTCSETQCFQCDVGYFLSSISTCSQCSSYCESCISSSECLVCTNGFTLVNSMCLLICSSNCLTCSSSSNCLTCATGYFLSGGSCYSCPLECATCSSLSTCLTCISGYVLSSNSCIVQCPSNCLSCTSSIDCLSCTSGYFVSGGLCTVCASNCLVCTSLTSCSQCKSSFYLSSGLCQSCPSVCTSCTSSSVCTGCQTSYTLTNGVCSPTCATGCKSCTSPKVCTTCLTGYYLSNGICYICSTGCTSCKGSASCSVCASGYYLKSGKCVACTTNCSKCTSTGCTTCKTGYTLSSGICK